MNGFDVTWRVEPFKKATQALELLGEGKFHPNPGKGSIEAWDLTSEEIASFEQALTESNALFERYERGCSDISDDVEIVDQDLVAMSLFENQFQPQHDMLCEEALSDEAIEYVRETETMTESAESYTIAFRPFDSAVDAFRAVAKPVLAEGSWGASNSRGVIEVWGENCQSIPDLICSMREAGFSVIQCDYPGVKADSLDSVKPGQLSSHKHASLSKMWSRDAQSRILG